MVAARPFLRPGTERWLVPLLAATVACICWFPAFDPPEATGWGDWQMIHHNWEAAYAALSRYGEWPLWDPYHCGGITSFGNPESQYYSPFFFLSFVFDPTIAVKLTVVAHAFLGVLGAWWLARRRFGVGPAGALVASVGWVSSGYFAWQIGGGHVTFLPFFFAPLLLLFWRRAAVDLRYAASVAALMTLTVLEGGTYPFPYFVVLLALDSVALLVRPTGEAPGAARDERFAARPSRAQFVAGAGTAAALTALLTAVRVPGILRTLELFPRQVESTDSLALGELVDIWTASEHDYRVAGHPWVWPEYCAYVGWAILALAALGIGVAIARKRWLPVVGLAFFVALVLGNRGPWAPWELLRHLPVFDSLRVPSRFSGLANLYLALLAGFGIDGIARLAARTKLGLRLPRARDILVAALALFAIVAPIRVGLKIVDRFDGAPIVRDPVPRYDVIRGDNYGAQYASLPARNLGTDGCYNGNMNWRVARGLWYGPGPQARIVAGSGEVLDGGRTANTAFVEVQMHGPGRVLVNQNYHPDWTSSIGAIVEDPLRQNGDRRARGPASDRAPIRAAVAGVGRLARRWWGPSHADRRLVRRSMVGALASARARGCVFSGRTRDGSGEWTTVPVVSGDGGAGDAGCASGGGGVGADVRPDVRAGLGGIVRTGVSGREPIPDGARRRAGGWGGGDPGGVSCRRSWRSASDGT